MGYLGAKNGSGVYQAIINLLPPHDTYIEPFLGTGAILRRKAPAQKDIGLDLNPACLADIENDHIELHESSAFEFLSEFDFTRSGRTVIYADPPYLLETRTSRNRYKFDFTTDDHIRLLNLLRSLDCFILVSGYQNNLYDEMLKGWFKTSFQAVSHGSVRTEVVWCNFEPKEIHFHQYAGSNFTERQQIKRKAERWSKKFAGLSAVERQVILSELLQVSGSNLVS